MGLEIPDDLTIPVFLKRDSRSSTSAGVPNEVRQEEVRGSTVKQGTKETALRSQREEQAAAKVIEGHNEQPAAATAVVEEGETKVKRRKGKAVKSNHNHNARTRVKSKSNGHDKATIRAQVIELCRSKHGATWPEIKALTGWPSISMPQVAESQGVKLRIERPRDGERHQRYFVA